MSDLGALPVQAYLLACLLAGGLGLWLARQSWLEREEPGGVEVTFYLACGGAFSLLYAVRVAGSSPSVMSVATQLSTPLLAAMPVLFASFTFAYAGHDRFRTERGIVALAAPAFVWTMVAWSSRTHGLARRSFEPVTDGPFTLLELGLGPVGLAFVLYAYALYFAGIVVIVDLYRRTGNRYRLQTFVALLGTLFPLLAGFVTVVDVGSFAHLDWTPVGFVLHGVFLYGTVFWLGTLDASVAARDTAVEVMQDPVIVSGSDGCIRDLNPAAAELLSADTVGASLNDVFPDLGTGSDRLLSIDGRRFDVQEDPITDPRGTGRGHVVLLRDVTERERRQAELERRETQLERQNERLEEFAGVVSHDLRNPLAAATAAVELVRHTDEDRDDALDRAATAHERMDDLIEGLLSLATAGKTLDSVETVSVEGATRTVWSRLETADAVLDFDGDDVTVRADGERLTQLLANLFRNAIEHGGDDATVRVSAERGDDGVTLRVADDGDGIDPGDRSRVFERGVSLNDGTGLGLSIVGDIADAHGWSVAIVDGPLSGACFEIAGMEPTTEAER
ncbi:histidine kinase N-terminal 7TM domain-containing protein [Halorubrum sp. DTA98]|uniref:sensor histidine kinase n=1 Tax=Halorubrum sp. DTA98 TaxID=3402163 RepID=UPI003AAC83CC